MPFSPTLAAEWVKQFSGIGLAVQEAFIKAYDIPSFSPHKINNDITDKIIEKRDLKPEI